ncbi:hypothetical protein PsYK624_051080 [Phanerochaete sordida]|uniref:Uncharacterized protein n=1 Tax=Phanerochaete sordida TaxID=48140 RepID=A0A9P3LBY6_9APHY|nr:hypothetical protein PsYK624_051080 [Phanerochaete sordida]
MIDPHANDGPQQPATPTMDLQQPGESHQRTVRVILEVIFIATAVFVLIMALLLRLMCLRRDHRPLKDFLQPLPPPSNTTSGRRRHDREASPHPSHSTTRSEQMRQLIFLPTLPIRAPQHPPAAHTVPGAPSLAFFHDDLSGIPDLRQAEVTRPPARRPDALSRYDTKDAPPKYEDAVLHSPSASEASSSSRPPGALWELRRSVSM